MLSITVQENIARSIIAIAPVRVWGHGSRDCQGDEFEMKMEEAYFHGMDDGFMKLQTALELRVDYQCLYVEHLQNSEQDLRDNYNDKSLISYPAYAAKPLSEIQHRIPKFILTSWEKDIRAVFNPTSVQCATMLDTDTYKEGITSTEVARTFTCQLYLVAALEAIKRIAPAWECDDDMYHDDKRIFYEDIAERPEMGILTTPPHASNVDKVRLILAEAKLEALELTRSPALMRMSPADYRAFWAEQWLCAYELWK